MEEGNGSAGSTQVEGWKRYHKRGRAGVKSSFGGQVWKLNLTTVGRLVKLSFQT